MSDINWDEAPEGAEYFYKHNWYKIINKTLFIHSEKFIYNVSKGYHWVNSGYIAALTEKMIERPKPIFTQEFRVLGGSIEVWQKCKIVFQGKRYTVVENENGKEFSRKTAKIKIRDIDTRTDEDKAIAGFNCHGNNDGLTPLASILALELVKAGKIHNVTWGK